MCTDLRIVVAGHSFVAHLKRFLDDDSDILNRYNYAFNLYRENAETSFVYRSGCDINFARNVLRTMILKNSPHLIILEIGSNDLSKPHIQPEKLAKQVLQLAQSLIQSCVKFVIVSAVIYRAKTKSTITPAEFNSKVDAYNEIMTIQCKQENNN